MSRLSVGEDGAYIEVSSPNHCDSARVWFNPAGHVIMVQTPVRTALKPSWRTIYRSGQVLSKYAANLVRDAVAKRNKGAA